MEISDVALAINLAAELREDSWDGLGYKLTFHQAAQKACRKYKIGGMTTPVHLLLAGWWDDILSWADNTLERKQ